VPFLPERHSQEQCGEDKSDRITFMMQSDNPSLMEETGSVAKGPRRLLIGPHLERFNFSNKIVKSPRPKVVTPFLSLTIAIKYYPSMKKCYIFAAEFNR
jgi:hypothetical protein